MRPRNLPPPVKTGGWNGTKSAFADSTPPASRRGRADARRTGLAASEGRLRAVVAAAGAHELLLKHRPLLFLEFHLDELERRGHPPKSLLHLLQSYGYDFETPLGKPLAPAAIHASASAVVRFVARVP